MPDRPPRPPVVRELTPVPDAADALCRFADLDGVLLLESASRRPRLGRYSFLTADPFRWFERSAATFGEDPLVPIAEAMRGFAVERDPALPPFQGGAAGLLGYELGGAWERLPSPRPDPLGLPVLAVGLYDWTLAWDHEQGRAWVVSQGFPADGPERLRRAKERAAWVADRLGTCSPSEPAEGVGWASAHQPSVPPWPSPIDVRRWAEAHPTAGSRSDVTSTFGRDAYLTAVERVVEYIRAGDIFQANLSQQFAARTDRSPVELYERTRTVNPAPFAGYFASGDWAVVSASPERFVAVRDGRVETRPIKGTRRRSVDPLEDLHIRADLLASEKDRAENVMIVDLLRNDLSRVCRSGTVEVPELCSLETYETVHHLVSAVTGELEPGRTAWDLLAAGFPGGSITGAPKVRAMEILHELEPTARGPYCGSLFYVGFDGTADGSILIRTMAVRGGEVRFGAGGGITVASEPAAEYEETLHKAAGMLRALG